MFKFEQWDMCYFISDLTRKVRKMAEKFFFKFYCNVDSNKLIYACYYYYFYIRTGREYLVQNDYNFGCTSHCLSFNVCGSNKSKRHVLFVFFLQLVEFPVKWRL